ncbi:hypothetical protein RCC89_13335 [Cytophagaceae bacterium ABcell3]|nr:hypothetical protein RCC89_13335 [Cytophagaceae bacterium ABcell3]
MFFFSLLGNCIHDGNNVLEQVNFLVQQERISEVNFVLDYKNTFLSQVSATEVLPAYSLFNNFDQNCKKCRSNKDIKEKIVAALHLKKQVLKLKSYKGLNEGLSFHAYLYDRENRVFISVNNYLLFAHSTIMLN